MWEEESDEVANSAHANAWNALSNVLVIFKMKLPNRNLSYF